MASFYDDEWFRGQVAEHEPTVIDLFGANLPTMSLLMVPLAVLDYQPARVVWTVTSLLLVITASLWLMRVLNVRGTWAPTFLCFVFLYQPLHENLILAQMYVLALALVSLAWYGYRQAQDRIVGMALGALLIAKTAGLMVWPLFLVQRHYRILVWGAATMLVVAVGALPVTGSDAWVTYLGKASELPSNPLLAVTAYQTQWSFFRHLFVYTDPRIGAPLVTLPFLGVILPWLGIAVFLGVSALAARRSGRSDLVFAAFVLISLILSPVSVDYHYVIALLPIAILLADLQNVMFSRRGWLLMIGALLIAADLPYRSPRLAEGAWVLFAYPKLYGALLLWGLAITCSLRDARITRGGAGQEIPLVEGRA